MARKKLKAPTPARVDASETLRMPTLSNSENTLTLSAVQAAFFSRLGLDATRARLSAELAGWRS